MREGLTGGCRDQLVGVCKKGSASGGTLFSMMGLKHPVSGHAVYSASPCGLNDWKLPLSRNSPETGPFVDLRDGRANFIGQSLAGGPSINQQRNGLLIHRATLMDVSSISQEWKYLRLAIADLTG